MAPTGASPKADQGDETRLVDRFGRVHDALRISVTDRCNIRCFYCMPEHASDFVAPSSLLSFDEIRRITRVLAEAGIRKIRLTGGEPLLRPRLAELVHDLNSIELIDEIALTTNGILLPQFARELKQAGLQRLNISLDTLSEATFQKIARRPGVQRVIDGIDHAIEVGFNEIRLNALAISGLTDDELIPLVEFAGERDLTLRFIEYMPLDGDMAWSDRDVLSGGQLRQRLERLFGPIQAIERLDRSQPSIDYQFVERRGRIGFINPVSKPFCGACNRLRLTADGSLRNCLFSDRDWDLRELLRSHADDQALLKLIRASVAAKEAGHLISRPQFQQPARAMYQIGG